MRAGLRYLISCLATLAAALFFVAGPVLAEGDEAEKASPDDRPSENGSGPAFSIQAETGWQAHAVLDLSGETISMEIYRDGVRERQETTLDGSLQVVIVRPSLGRVFILTPEEDNVFDVPIQDAGLFPFSVGFDEVEANYLGVEMMGGEATHHYHVAGMDRLGQYFDGEVWVTPDGIPLRISGTLDANGDSVDFTLQLSLLSRGEQPDYLFAPPVEQPEPLQQGG